MNILVVVAHSDDETIGLGATIKRHILLGDSVSVISMTDGVGAREKTQSDESILRAESARSASEILGFSWAAQYDFKDNELDDYPLLDIVKSIEEIKLTISPDIIYTHSSADLNIDHRVVLNAVLIAFRPQPHENYTEIRLFEVASATDYGSTSVTGIFEPNLFVNITETWDAKEAALHAYKSELREYPHSRSLAAIKNQAKMRGSQVGLLMAEAFQVIRKIER
jgi:LmbE family N-acetylglucosaminyl deacetylase